MDYAGRTLSFDGRKQQHFLEKDENCDLTPLPDKTGVAFLPQSDKPLFQAIVIQRIKAVASNSYCS